MACEYCDKGTPICLASYAELHITSDNHLEVDQFSSLDGHFLVSDAVPINFCPMCGDRLFDEKRANPIEGLEDAVDSVIEKYPNTLEMLGDE